MVVDPLRAGDGLTRDLAGVVQIAVLFYSTLLEATRGGDDQASRFIWHLVLVQRMVRKRIFRSR